MHVVPVHEGDRDARFPGPSGATDTVQIVLLVLRDGVVDDVGHVVDVDAASRDIRRHHDILLAGLERSHRALARLLIHIAVHRGGVEPAVLEFFGQFRRCTLGAGEDYGLAAAFGLQDARDHLVLVQAVRAVHHVPNVGLHETLVGVGRTDVDGPVHEAAGERDDRAGHRRRKQHGVPGRVGLGEQFLDVAEEPEVEHLVRLVEHHHPHVLQ